MASDSTSAARLRGITKRFGSLTANDAVNLDVAWGRILAIVGENGAGKTTLVRILSGLLQPDSGDVFINGEQVRLISAEDAARHGIGMVSQHYSIIPELSCLDNLLLGAEQSFVLHRAEAEMRATALADSLGFSFEWRKPASALSSSGMQRLEIVRMIWRGARIMILDEPTAMLSPEDGESVYRNLRALAEDGCAIIIVTHRIGEVLKHCDDVVALRNGRNVGAMLVSKANAEELSRMMIGESLPPLRKASSSASEGCLSLSGFTVASNGGIGARDVALDVACGEVVGIAGMDGSGQAELFEGIYGLRPFKGRATFFLEDLGMLSTAARIQRGMRMIPEERAEQGLVMNWPLADNGILGLQNTRSVRKGILIQTQAKRVAAIEAASRFDTKYRSLSDAAASLSGGNQQRFVAGRALSADARLLLAFQPARGLDVKGSRRVYEEIRNQAARGLAVIVVAFDVDELFEFCDRITVMFDGKLSLPPLGKEFDKATIGRMMAGLSV